MRKKKAKHYSFSIFNNEIKKNRTFAYVIPKRIRYGSI